MTDLLVSVEPIGSIAARTSYGLPYLVAIACVRVLPFAVYALRASELGVAARLAWAAVYGSLVVALLPSEANQRLLLLTLLAYAYYFALTSAACWLRTQYTAGRAGRLAVFAACFALFWALPLAAIRGDTLVFALLASELTLSAYAFCVDRPRDPSPRTLSDCRFFLLVDPTLCWSERGHRVSGASLHVPSLLRIALGCGAIALGLWVELLMREPGNLVSVAPASVVSLSPFAIAHGVAKLVALYAAHSGVASLRIGLMRLIGYEVPECYRFPLLARSPGDLWMRWNQWVVTWFRVYVFVPVGARFRRLGTAKRAHGVAAVVTFLGVGLYHDVFIWTTEEHWTLARTAWFIGAALVVLLWNEAERTLRRQRLAWAGGPRVLFGLGQVVAYVLFLRLVLIGLLGW